MNIKIKWEHEPISARDLLLTLIEEWDKLEREITAHGAMDRIPIARDAKEKLMQYLKDVKGGE